MLPGHNTSPLPHLLLHTDLCSIGRGTSLSSLTQVLSMAYSSTGISPERILSKVYSPSGTDLFSAGTPWASVADKKTCSCYRLSLSNLRDVCSGVILHGLQKNSLLHHSLLLGLERNVCFHT